MDNLLNSLVEITKNDMFLLGIVFVCILLFVLYVANIIKLNKIKKEYKKFLEKLGNGSNIEEILSNHLDRINKVITKNEELEKLSIFGNEFVSSEADTIIEERTKKVGNKSKAKIIKFEKRDEKND